MFANIRSLVRELFREQRSEQQNPANFKNVRSCPGNGASRFIQNGGRVAAQWWVEVAKKSAAVQYNENGVGTNIFSKKIVEIVQHTSSNDHSSSSEIQSGVGT